MSNVGGSENNARKQAVSLRMSRSDLRHVKRLAARLGTSDSDLIRYAIKSMLAKLAPLQDPAARGRGLVPLFVESGADLVRHFELDALRLSEIINEGAEQECRVEADDIHLLAMSGIAPGLMADFAASRFEVDRASERAVVNERPSSERSLQQYLFRKYRFPVSPVVAINQGGGT